MRKLIEQPSFDVMPQGAAGKSHKHESAERQVSGQARYIDDMPEAANIHHVAVGVSSVTTGTITSIDLTLVKASEGVIDVITVDDIPGHKDIGPVFPGDPLLAGTEILYHSQPIFAVLATSLNLARRASLKANIVILPTEACLTVNQAKQQENFVRPPHFMRRGNFQKSYSQSPIHIEGEMVIGGQEHMYLEGQVSMAIPEEEDRMLVYSSSQHPSEVQKLIA
jgi:xanthine dehydrogenase large subunit